MINIALLFDVPCFQEAAIKIVIDTESRCILTNSALPLEHIARGLNIKDNENVNITRPSNSISPKYEIKAYKNKRLIACIKSKPYYEGVSNGLINSSIIGYTDIFIAEYG